MRDISAWLRELGLEKYAKAFHENEIDFESLPVFNRKYAGANRAPDWPEGQIVGSDIRTSPVI